MAVQWKAGSFTIATTDTVSKAVTGVGFQPQGYYLTSVGLATSTATGTSHTLIGDGITDGTRQYAHSIGIRDGNTATGAGRFGSASRVLHLEAYDGVDRGSFSHASMDADGFTLTTNVAATTNFVVYYLAWAGMDSQYLDVFALPAATGSFSRTAAGFQPDALLWLGASIVTLDAASSVAARHLGWSLADGTQFSIGERHVNTGTTNYTGSSAATSRVICLRDATGTAISPETSITTHDATGFTADRLTGTAAPYVAVMHFKGGAWAAGTFAAQSSTGTFSLATAGVHPEMLMLMSSNITTASLTAPFEGGSVAWGAATGASDSFALQHHSFNNETLNPNVTEEYSRGDTAKLWIDYTRTSADTFAAAGEIALTAFIAGQITLDQTDADPTAVLIGYLTNGDAPVAGSGVPGSLMMMGIGT